MKVLRWGARLGVCGLLALAFASGCRRETPSSFDSNLAPETIISGAPAESTAAYYRVHIKWYGVDPDGLIDYYEYSVTDSNKTPGEDNPGFSGYFRTDRTDSIFILQANNTQVLGHRFYVRSVDNEGKTDPTPAWTYFIAEDFNLPVVCFRAPGLTPPAACPAPDQRYAIGTWTDRAGNLRSTRIYSSNRNAPTDTIGVGGSVRFAWYGFDIDVGDSVVGFEYRMSGDPEYQGGTLADTSFSFDFARPVGSSLATYFSGNEAILVHAIDVAGARTNPDSARSFVVNFGPITWIVDPNQVDPPVRARLFTDRESQIVWPSGTWLADGVRVLQFKYTGFDDPRDQSLDPNNPTGITGFQARVLKNGGGEAFRDVPAGGWLHYPQVSEYVSSGLQSGDYLILVRSRDELGRYGRPDTLRVKVNYAPFLEYVRYADTTGAETDLWAPGTTDTVSITIPELPGGGYPGVRIRFNGRDDHYPPPNTHPGDPNPVVEQEAGRVKDYVARLNGARDGFVSFPEDSLGQPLPVEIVYPVGTTSEPGFIQSGLNRLELRVRDLPGRISTYEIVFHVTLE
jgi:hypothetical protein